MRKNVRKYLKIYWRKHGAFKLSLLLSAQFKKSFHNGMEFIEEIEDTQAAPLLKTKAFLVENLK